MLKALFRQYRYTTEIEAIEIQMLDSRQKNQDGYQHPRQSQNNRQCSQKGNGTQRSATAKSAERTAKLR